MRELLPASGRLPLSEYARDCGTVFYGSKGLRISDRSSDLQLDGSKVGRPPRMAVVSTSLGL